MKELRTHMLGAAIAALLWMFIPVVQALFWGESLRANPGFMLVIFLFLFVVLFVAALPLVALGYPLIKRLGYTTSCEWLLCGFIGGTLAGFATQSLMVITSPEWNGYQEIMGWPRAMLFVEHYVRGALTGMAFAWSYWYMLERNQTVAKPVAKAAAAPVATKKVAAKPVAKPVKKAPAKKAKDRR